MSENGQQRGADRNVDNVDPDVLLDIPKVSVDSIRLAVDGLDADLSLRARVANLLQVDAGVRVHLSGVELDINGVQAEAQLRVRLEQLTNILGRALDTLDSNPQIIESLARTATAVDDVNRSAQQLAAGAAEFRASARRSDGVLDERTAVADRGLPGVAQPGADRTGPERPGPVGSEPERSRPEPGPVGSEPGPVGSERMAAGPGPRTGGPGQARPAERRPEHEAPRRPEGERSGSGERPEGTAGRSGDRPDQPAPSGPGPSGAGPSGAGPSAPAPSGPGLSGPAPSGPAPSGDGDGGLSTAAQAAAQNAAQFAEQAGETLRQAGRSVWEAIQGGIAQHRPQSHRDE
ncbi:hypothetical protein O7631_06175 [Micromonospora sp. WMMD967]|uniref:hypothetical protein n=1 Tax=Micromonospora sp. WMMD967 TaxID=3016101 RepID=UPI002417E875|nr:hypothetical protein [Micromonospora sp. WMMD967]MDG4836100.1 hypothetical protein [Micromonospora sp. WMMD967]